MEIICARDRIFRGNEQFRILVNDLEDYLEPIHQSDARFVVCLMPSDYPTRDWTRFEAAAFRQRLQNGSVISVLIDEAIHGILHEVSNLGDVLLTRGKELETQAIELVELFKWKMMEPQARNTQSNRLDFGMEQLTILRADRRSAGIRHLKISAAMGQHSDRRQFSRVAE